jgi:hypothetical protein
MRRLMMMSALLGAVSLSASGCVVVSGNRAEIGPGGLSTTCGSNGPAGVRREQLMEATTGFERIDRLAVICADSGTKKVLLSVAGTREGGGHGDRTFVVHPDHLEPVT